MSNLNKEVFSSKLDVPQFIAGGLAMLSMKDIFSWLQSAKEIDKQLTLLGLDDVISTNPGNHFISPKTVELLRARLKHNNIETCIDLQSVQVFDGYQVYEFPDGGELRDTLDYPSLWYGLAKISRIEAPHIHKYTDSYNLVLEGHGIFCGIDSDRDKYVDFHHGKSMYPGAEFFIPASMTHGHTVRNGEVLWMFFAQEKGFRAGLSGDGDYHKIKNFSISDLFKEFR